MILLLLPPGTVLKLQSVCRQWKSIISRSSKIQRHLFFQADGQAVIPIRNDAPWTHETPVTYKKELRVNNLIFVDRPFAWGPHDVLGLELVILIVHSNGRTGDNVPHQWTPFKYDMFITQPPCTTVILRLEGRPWRGDIVEKPPHLQNRCTLHDPEGIRFGLLGNTAAQMIHSLERGAECPCYRLWVRFRMPVSLAAKETWDEIHEIEQRRYRIATRLRKIGGVPNWVRYRHHLDDASLAHYDADVEGKSGEESITSIRNERGRLEPGKASCCCQ